MSAVSDQIKSRNHLAKVISISKIALDTYELIFKIDGNFDYKPGQYVWIQIPQLKYPDPKGSRRAMSISSPKNNKNEITVILRGGASGFKKTLMELKKGNEIKIIGPFGQTFCLPEDNKKPLIFIGGGVGIAPFLCLIRYSIANKLERTMTLFSVNSNSEKSAYSNEIESFVKNSPNYNGIILNRKITWDDIKTLPNLSESLFYVTGPQSFVDYISLELTQNGIFNDQIKYENFYPTTPEVQLLKKIFVNSDQQTIEESDIELLKEHESILRNAIESTSHHIIITDNNGSVVFANAAAQRITGYSFEEMIGETPRLWGGMMSDDFYKKLWKCKLEGITIDEEIVNRRKDGSLYTVLAHISPIKNRLKQIIGYIGTEEDITNIKEQEEKLHVAEERWSFALEGSKDGVWDWNLETNEVYFSRQWKAMLGFAEDEIKNDLSEWSARVHPDDLAFVENEINKHISGQLPFYQSEHRVKMKNGGYKWILDRGKIVSYNTEGKPIRMVGTHTDLDEIKNKELQLKSLTERYELATASGRIGVWKWDILNNTLDANDQFYALYQSSKDDFIKAKEAWLSFIHPDERESVIKKLEEALNSKKEFNLTVKVILSDGTIHYFKILSNINRDSTGKPTFLVGVLSDVTMEKNLDQMKDEFLSIASHELRTPLTAIDGLISMILDGEYGQISDNIKQPLIDIGQSSERLIHLVNDLLSVSRLQAGRVKYTLSSFDINVVINKAIEMLAVVAKSKNLTIQVISQESILVQADIDKVEQILTNLIGNSLKFTDVGGITVDYQKDKDLVNIYIKDTGIGIKDTDSKKIFDKFQQLDSGKGRPAGTGLGLFITKQFCQKMGGNLWLENSEPGKGSVFAFSIPLSGSLIAKKVKEEIDNEAKLHPDQK